MKQFSIKPSRSLRLASRFGLISCTLLFLLICTPALTAFAGGEDYVTVLLRTDRESIQKGTDFIHSISPYPPMPTTGGETRGYFNITFTTYQNIWVGLITKSAGVQWFVSTTVGSITCLRGSSAWGGGACLGAYADHTSLTTWSKVELVSYTPGTWIARIYDEAGNAADLATISVSSTALVMVSRVEGQEAWTTSTDPHLNMAFYHKDPSYMKSGVWQLWPGTTATSQHNRLFTAPTGVCPTYYAGNVTVTSSHINMYTGKNASPALCWIDPAW